MERQLILKEMDIADLEMQKNYCNLTLQGSVPKANILPDYSYLTEINYYVSTLKLLIKTLN